MTVYISGEDDVTREVAKRLARYCLGDVSIDFVILSQRSNGTSALDHMNKAVALGKTERVVCVYDSDGDCPLEILKKYAPNGWKNPYVAINIAITEAESWLLADRDGLAEYYGVDIDKVPAYDAKAGEVTLNYKPSLYILRDIAPSSKFKDKLLLHKNKKPPVYNTVMVPFIRTNWNIANALQYSKSLSRAIERIRTCLEC